LGFCAHSGWACAILLADANGDVEVIDRRRIALHDPKIPASMQPYHEAESMTLASAQSYIARCETATRRLASRALIDLHNVARDRSLKLAGVCILAAPGPALPDLKSILASRALIHAAEGELYRDALVRACEAEKLPVRRIEEQQAAYRTARYLQIDETALRARLARFGKALGPPWGTDEKAAATAAWLVLAA
jgi:hypothetical protein